MKKGDIKVGEEAGRAEPTLLGETGPMESGAAAAVLLFFLPLRGDSPGRTGVFRVFASSVWRGICAATLLKGGSS